jgi:hypothetical protein
MDPAQALDPCDDDPPCEHGYGRNTISLFLRLVMNGVSLRCVPRVLRVIAEAFGLPLEIPHWTTGRLWLMRLGHAMLTTPLTKGKDWAWLADHSVQIGQEKGLAILGIRLRDLPARGECLELKDLYPIAWIPRKSWTRREVDEALEQAARRTGVPRVIVDDHGADLAGGVKFFQERHPGTAEIYDMKHKAACLLKHRLEKEPRWQAFQRQVGKTRCAVQQTEMAFLAPRAPKPKARFMNLQSHLDWAEGVLVVLRQPPAEVLQWARRERLQEKFGWLEAFAEPLAEWSEWQQVVNHAVEFVNHQGIYRGAGQELRRQLPRKFAHSSTATLAKELVAFVAAQAKPVKHGERFPGSTEVLESCFGKMKVLEKQQSQGGFTNFMVSFGALLAETTATAVHAAMKHSGTHDVYQWCKDHLGTTLFTQRKFAFAPSTTKPG